jgi:hypothetical protein
MTGITTAHAYGGIIGPSTIVLDHGEMVAICPNPHWAARIRDLLQLHGLVDTPTDTAALEEQP